MSDLAKNNIDAQVELMKDIVQNYKSIIYSVSQGGQKIRELLKQVAFTKDEKNITLSRESYEKLFDIACNLEDERKFYKLGILAEKAVPDNEIKLKILQTLQKH